MTAGPGKQPGMRFAGVVVLATALALGVAAGSGLAQVRVPPDFKMPKAESSPGEVSFSHATHRAKVDKCSTCHMKDFKLKRGASGRITLAAKAEGKFCGACHDGKTTFGGAVAFPIDQCDSCHKD